MNRIEGVDGDAEAVDIIVCRSRGYEFEDPLSYRGVKETDADGGRVAGTAGLDRGKGVCALEEPLEGFEEAVEEYSGGEPTGADEDFHDAGGCLDG